MPDSISILSYSHDQLDAVWQLRLRALKDHPEAFGEPWDSASRRTSAEIEELSRTFWVGGDNQLFIALDPEGVPVGMLGIFREGRPRERHRMQLWGVYVSPEYRGHGIASDLARTAIDYARSLDGVLQIHLTVWTDNHAAVNSYSRLGFQRWGTMPRADIIDGVALDYDHMVLMLDQPAPASTEGTP